MTDGSDDNTLKFLEPLGFKNCVFDSDCVDVSGVHTEYEISTRYRFDTVCDDSSVCRFRQGNMTLQLGSPETNYNIFYGRATPEQCKTDDNSYNKTCIFQADALGDDWRRKGCGKGRPCNTADGYAHGLFLFRWDGTEDHMYACKITVDSLESGDYECPQTYDDNGDPHPVEFKLIRSVRDVPKPSKTSKNTFGSVCDVWDTCSSATINGQSYDTTCGDTEINGVYNTQRCGIQGPASTDLATPGGCGTLDALNPHINSKCVIKELTGTCTTSANDVYKHGQAISCPGNKAANCTIVNVAYTDTDGRAYWTGGNEWTCN